MFTDSGREYYVVGDQFVCVTCANPLEVCACPDEERRAAARAILTHVEPGRWQRAVDAWASGQYTLSVRYPTSSRTCATITTQDGATYQTSIGHSGFYYCDCPDSTRRRSVGPCKHALALALHVTRPLRREGN